MHGGYVLLWLKNSAILTLGAVIVSTAVSPRSPRSRSPGCDGCGRNVFFAISTALMVVPPVVMLMPLFILFTNLNLVSTYQGVVLIYAGLTLPFSVFMLTNFFRAIPNELLESARHGRSTARSDSLPHRAPTVGARRS